MKVISFLSLILCAACTYGQNNRTAIVHDLGYSFTLTAPEGWKHDLKAGKDLGLPIVFYPDTSIWEKAPVVMYVSIAFKNDSDQKTIEDVMRYDWEQFEKKAFDLKVERTKSRALTTFTQKREAHVYDFVNEGNNNYESVAYIDEEDLVVMIVYGTREKERHKKVKPAFEQLVLSYYWSSR